jgi:nitroreductase
VPPRDNGGPALTPTQSHLIPRDRGGYEAVVRESCQVRRFEHEPVPRADVEHMVALATFAASPCSPQAWRLIAVQDADLLAAMQAVVVERLEELALRPQLALHRQKREAAIKQALLFAKAPLCIAVLTLPPTSPMEELMELAGVSREEHDRLCARPELQSAGAAVQVLSTSAHAMGYAACWTCAPIVAGERLGELLDVAPPARLVALVAIGRPAELPTTHKRLPLEQVLSFR